MSLLRLATPIQKTVLSGGSELQARTTEHVLRLLVGIREEAAQLREFRKTLTSD